jgi:uncharacterized protein (DUF1501 family)
VTSPIALDARLGLHPAFARLAPLYARGELLALAGVGFPASQQLASHLAVQRGFVEILQRSFGTRALPRLEGREAHAGALHSPAEPLSEVLEALARELRQGRAPNMALVSVPGFDTHFAQRRRLSQAFEQLAAALETFVDALGDRYADTAVLIVSERGRSFRENRTAGTDDGHSGAALLLGGAVRGGRVLGSWPQLSALESSRDAGLPVTLELSRLLAELSHGLWAAPLAPGLEPLEALGLLRVGGTDAG